jgi:hypothetical protein
MKTLSALLLLSLLIGACNSGGHPDVTELYDLAVTEFEAKKSNDDVEEFQFTDMPSGKGETKKDPEGEIWEVKSPGIRITILTAADGEKMGSVEMEYVTVEDGKEDEEKGFALYQDKGNGWVEFK